MKGLAMLSLMILVSCVQLVAQRSDFPNTDFSRADSIAGQHAAHSLKDIKGLANKLTIALPTEQEKFRAIFRWVCDNIAVDYKLVLLNTRKRSKLEGEKLVEWNKKFNATVFETLLEDHKTICTGYAYLIRELAFHAGLKCHIVNGYADPRGIDRNCVGEVNHSWNIVLLNNKWYVCDATWASGIINRRTEEFEKKYRDEYFLPDMSWFESHHRTGGSSVASH